MVTRWAAAVSVVGFSTRVVDTLLGLASLKTLRPAIPVEIWACLKEQPSRSPEYWEARLLVRYVRQLGDVNILKSYFLLVWSEWTTLTDSVVFETRVSILKNLGGIEMQYHREDLIKRLDHILKELDRWLDYRNRFNSANNVLRRRKEEYQTLREVLLEADRNAMSTSLTV